MADENQVAAPKTDEKPKKERTDWPRKFRNFAPGPLALETVTHGGISLGGKQTIWLWSDDYAMELVQHHIRQELLAPWEDGEEQPKRPTAMPSNGTVDLSKLDAVPGLVKGPDGEMVQASQTLGAVLTEEGSKNEPPPVNFTPPGGSGGGEEADSGPTSKKKRG
jgi:hypothetical protein